MKVALYIRVSTQEQGLEGYSIPAQISTLKQYAVANNYLIYETYQDIGISGKNIKDRPELLRLIEDAKKHKFDTVLVWKLSRLSRSLLDMLSIVDILSTHNIAFQSFSEKFDTSTPTGKMLLHMLGSIAEFERNTIIENVKLGLNERFNQGYSKGKVPFGYTYDNKQAAIVPEQAEIVKFAFKYYLSHKDGNCLQYLADYFTQQGFTTTKGGQWSRSIIRETLMNKFYAGYVRTGVLSHGRKKENYSEQLGAHEPIIDLDIFEKVNAKLDSKKIHSFIKSPDSDCVLTGLIICPLCGDKLTGLNSRQRYKNINGTYNTYPIKAYRCINSTKGKSFCSGFTIAASKIEPFVLSRLYETKSKKTFASIVAKAKKQSKENNKPVIDQISIIDKQIAENIEIKNRYQKLFETGKVDITLFADRLIEISNKIELLENERKELSYNTIDLSDENIMDSFKNVLSNFNDFYERLDNIGKKECLRAIIKEIIITESKQLQDIKTHWNMNL